MTVPPIVPSCRETGRMDYATPGWPDCWVFPPNTTRGRTVSIHPARSGRENPFPEFNFFHSPKYRWRQRRADACTFDPAKSGITVRSLTSLVTYLPEVPPHLNDGTACPQFRPTEPDRAWNFLEISSKSRQLQSPIQRIERLLSIAVRVGARRPASYRPLVG